jgi:LPXTG-motif cell wall-anchored protein
MFIARQISPQGGVYLKGKRFSALFILVLILGTFFSSIASAEKSENQNLVALGDSITAGYHLPGQTGLTPSPKAFPNLIEGDFNVTNLGVPGLTSTQLLTEVTTDPNFINSLKSADVVTLDIGGNDLLKAAGVTDLSQLSAPVQPTDEILNNLKAAGIQLGDNLSKIIAAIKLQTKAPIILYNIYNPFGESSNPILSSLHTFGEQFIPSVNLTIIRPIALQSGALLADAYNAFNGKQAEYIIPGDVHPTKDGHEALAKLADIALKTLDQSGQDNNQSGDDHSGHDNSGDDHSGQDNSGNNHSGHDNPGDDHSGHDNSGDDHSGHDNSGDDHSGHDHSGDDHSGDDHSGHDNPGDDNPGQDNSGQNNPGQDNSGQNNPGQTVTPVQTTTTDLPTPIPTTSAIPVTTYTTSGTNYSLPNTATPYYNYLAAGFVLIMAGLSVLIIQRKKTSSKTM